MSSFNHQVRQWLARVLCDGPARGSVVPIILSVFLTDFFKFYNLESFIVFVSLEDLHDFRSECRLAQTCRSILEPGISTYAGWRKFFNNIRHNFL